MRMKFGKKTALSTKFFASGIDEFSSHLNLVLKMRKIDARVNPEHLSKCLDGASNHTNVAERIIATLSSIANQVECSRDIEGALKRIERLNADPLSNLGKPHHSSRDVFRKEAPLLGSDLL